jgi:hypothetical protein
MRCVLAATLLAAPFVAASQTCTPLSPGALQLESDRYFVGLRTEPVRVAVGQHFSVELTVCKKDGAATPTGVALDAHMPEHRHGMNYKPRVIPVTDERFSATGLMFHMPGKWEFVVDVRSGGSTDRLTKSIVVE